MPSRTLAENSQFSMEPFRVVTMLKSHNEVIRKTNENHFSARLLLSPLLSPEIEYVVKKNIG